MNKQNFIIFGFGIITALLIVPMLKSFGLSFDVFLTNVFGENRILGTVFSVGIILILLFMMYHLSRNDAKKPSN